MDSTFTNFQNSKTSDSYRLLLNLTNKINLKGSDKYVALSNFSIYYTWKNIKKSYRNNKIENISSNKDWRIWITRWIIFYIRYSRLLWIYIKTTWRKYYSIRIYVNKIVIQEGGFLNFLRPLISAGLQLMKNVLTPLAKSVLSLLGLTAGIAETDPLIQKKISRLRTTTLIISNKEIEDLMKMFKCFEQSGLLIKGVSETIKNKAK